MASQIETFARRYIELAVAGYIDDDEAIVWHHKLLDAQLGEDDGPKRREPAIPLPKDKARAYIVSCLAAHEGINPNQVKVIMRCTYVEACRFIREVTGRDGNDT